MKIKTTLSIETKSFTKTDTGEKIDYMEILADIGGHPVRMSVKQDDKSLFKFLLDRLPADAKA